MTPHPMPCPTCGHPSDGGAVRVCWQCGASYSVATCPGYGPVSVHVPTCHDCAHYADRSCSLHDRVAEPQDTCADWQDALT